MKGYSLWHVVFRILDAIMGHKFQITSIKLQINFKSQYSMTKTYAITVADGPANAGVPEMIFWVYQCRRIICFEF